MHTSIIFAFNLLYVIIRNIVLATSTVSMQTYCYTTIGISDIMCRHRHYLQFARDVPKREKFFIFKEIYKGRKYLPRNYIKQGAQPRFANLQNNKTVTSNVLFIYVSRWRISAAREIKSSFNLLSTLKPLLITDIKNQFPHTYLVSHMFPVEVKDAVLNCWKHVLPVVLSIIRQSIAIQTNPTDPNPWTQKLIWLNMNLIV